MTQTDHIALHWVWVCFAGAVGGFILIAIIFWIRKRLDK
jgi:hypothetical protein